MKFTELFKSNSFIIVGTNKAIELAYRVQLPAPAVIIYEGGLASWSKVYNALSYNIRVNKTTVLNTTETKYQLAVGETIEVQAVGNNVTYMDSNWSSIQTYYGTYSYGLAYTSNGNGTCYVSGIGSCQDSDVRIPPTNGSEQVIGIGDYAFSGCTTIASVIMTNSITFIGSYAFRKCPNLRAAAVSSSVNSIGDLAFYGCTGLVNLEIPTGVTAIGEGAFENCSGLTSIQIPETISILNNNVFMGCTGLQNVTLSEGVKIIKRNAFQNCRSLVELNIPSSITTIEDASFIGCRSLRNLPMSDNVTNLGNTVFSKCANLETIKLPESISTVGDRLFHECNRLKTVTLPEITYIGTYALYNCSNLTTITYAGSTADWNKVLLGKDWNRGAGIYTVQCKDGVIKR